MFSLRHDEVLDAHLGVPIVDLVLEAALVALAQNRDVAHDLETRDRAARPGTS